MCVCVCVCVCVFCVHMYSYIPVSRTSLGYEPLNRVCLSAV